ncbi:MAG: DNA translocase FtsK 4TM domain-containing protein [Spirochaetota bacterium]
MSERKEKLHMNVGSSPVAGISLIIIGFFILVVLWGYHPNNPQGISIEVSAKAGHFMGPAGIAISSFFFYFFGSSVYLFSFLLMYTGYIFLRKISTIKKIGFLLLAVSCFISFLIFSCLLKVKKSPSKMGIFGRMIISSLVRHGRVEWMIPFSGILLLGELFFLIRFPAGFLVNFFKNLNIFGSSKKSKPVCIFNRERIKRKAGKPPLLRKVYYEEVEPSQNLVLRGLKTEVIAEGQSAERSLPRDEIYIMEKELERSTHNESHSDLFQSSLLHRSSNQNRKEREKETTKKAIELEKTLKEFGIEAKVVGITRGPVITRYELQPAPGVKLSRIVNLSNNIALNLSANGVRIEAPIPGRSAVGIEIPNEEREIVTLGDLIQDAKLDGELPIILGKNISGDVVVADLAAMPHLLIAGATGSGKSVCVNSIIVSILFQKEPEEVRFIFIDPKMVELKVFNGIPHLLTEVVTDPRDVVKVLKWLLYEMENRYVKLDEIYARNIAGYNQKSGKKMPYIVVIVDEFANLMAVSQKEVEEAVVRLAAMSRAVGIHLIMATQRPSVDVITGLIKANFPYRIAFQVASKTDSRTILDFSGAEKLLGKGDMLFAPAGSMNIQRLQGAFISEEEVFNVVEELKKRGSPNYIEDIWSFERDGDFDADYEDPIFDQAVEIVLKTKRASASFLQRRLKIGYNRAARLIELMEEEGIIGPPRGSKPREVYIEKPD